MWRETRMRGVGVGVERGGWARDCHCPKAGTAHSLDRGEATIYYLLSRTWRRVRMTAIVNVTTIRL